MRKVGMFGWFLHVVNPKNALVMHNYEMKYVLHPAGKLLMCVLNPNENEAKTEANEKKKGQRTIGEQG